MNIYNSDFEPCIQYNIRLNPDQCSSIPSISKQYYFIREKGKGYTSHT